MPKIMADFDFSYFSNDCSTFSFYSSSWYLFQVVFAMLQFIQRVCDNSLPYSRWENSFSGCKTRRSAPTRGSAQRHPFGGYNYVRFCVIQALVNVEWPVLHAMLFLTRNITMHFLSPLKKKKIVQIMLLDLLRRTCCCSFDKDSSRLGCQIKITEDMDGMEVQDRKLC